MEPASSAPLPEPRYPAKIADPPHLIARIMALPRYLVLDSDSDRRFASMLPLR